ncbi:TPA: hypothetical protein I8235_001462 [Kluyvera intermedia]|nr:hypothetical protein [Kluyvera intermedia]
MDDMKLAKSSFVISVASVFVAVCALLLSVYQGHLQKINYETSVQPHITIIPTIDGAKKEYGYYFYNSGVGPGYVDEIQYYINGRRIVADNLSALAQIVRHFGLNEKCFSYGNPREGDAVSLNEMTTLLTISTSAHIVPECAKTIQSFQDHIIKIPSDISFKVRYKSIYNIAFIYNSKDNSQKKL